MEKNNNRDVRLKSRAKKCLKGNEIEYQNETLIIPSRYTYKGVWNWDSMFHAIAVSDWDLSLALAQIKYFTERQAENGMYYDAFLTNGKIFKFISKPPVVAWALSEIMKKHPNGVDIDYFYRTLSKNIKFWETYRLKNGLFSYDSFAPEETYEIHCKCESGWDNSVRWDRGAEKLWAIDLNSYMALTYKILSDFALKLGLQKESEQWSEKYQVLGKKINEKLWCEEIGAYCDYDFISNEFTKVVSPASFFPLFANVADFAKASALKKLAEDERKFFPLFPTVSYDDKDYSSSDYWRGPTWLNVSYFALKGLKNYGFNEIFDGYKNRLLDMCDKEKRGLFEYYDSRTGKGLGAKQFGWTAAFVLQFINEI